MVLGGTVEPGDRVVGEAERGELEFDVERGGGDTREAREAEREPAGSGARGA